MKDLTYKKEYLKMVATIKFLKVSLFAGGDDSQARGKKRKHEGEEVN